MISLFKKILGTTWVWTLLLALSAAAFVWFAGPLLAIADHKIWASSSVRWFTISALFLLWGLWGISSRRAVPSSEDESPDSPAAIIDAQKSLRLQFKHALRALQTSGLYQGRSERWRSQLPWYLVVGAAGTGKTSLLNGSGLEFPLNDISQVYGREPDAHEHCEWYFAENGVLIDTSSHCLEQKNPVVDGAAWQTLLTLLRTRRRSRPLNGVLVAVPVPVLQTGDREEVIAMGRVIRARLHEIQQRLRMDVPVYLVLTKTDQVTGFDAFFDQLSREESQQILGATFDEGHSMAHVETLLQPFEQLLERLNAQVILRLHPERDILRRGLMLEFPGRLGAIAENLGYLAGAAFTGNRYQRASKLRGFYFTSALHQPERALGEALSTESRPQVAKPRFIHDLLTRVIFPEAELAWLDQREVRRLRWRQRSLYAMALACVMVFGLIWARSFSLNHDALETARMLADQHALHRAQLDPADDVMAILPVLDTRHAAARIFAASGPTIVHGGLYQGDIASAVFEQAYQRALTEQLLVRVSRTLEGQVRANLGDRGRLLDSLRAYLMLGLTEHRDQRLLMETMKDAWSQRYVGDADVQKRLEEHFGRLLNLPFSQSLDTSLVARAREVLRNESLAVVVYRSLRDQARALPEYRLEHHLGSRGSILVGTDQVIPGLFTQRGYQQYFLGRGPTLVSDILSDNWILGERAGPDGADVRKTLAELEQLYFADYANFWSEAVARVGFKPFTNARAAADHLAGLTAANSPLVLLLGQIRHHTRITAPLEMHRLIDATGIAGQVRTALPTPFADGPRQSLQRRFEALHRLLDEHDQPAADLAAVMGALNDLHLNLAELGRAGLPGQVAYRWAKARMTGEQADALDLLRSTSARLPGLASNWFGELADDSWTLVLGQASDLVEQHYQTELHGFYQDAIHGRYPFDAHSVRDVALSDFREFFRPEGMIDTFIDRHLRPFVSEEAGGFRIRSIDGRGLPLSRALLMQLSHAKGIQQRFFAEDSNRLFIRFKLEPHTLDPHVGRAEFRLGDQLMVYRHGPVVPMAFQWPDETGDGRASLVLEALEGDALGIEKNGGPWSLFRLMDLMQQEPQSGRDVLMLKARIGGMGANYLASVQRSANPFDLSAIRSFHMPATL